MNEPHDKYKDNSQLFAEFLAYIRTRCRFEHPLTGEPVFYRVPVSVVDLYIDSYNANLHRMTKEERKLHYDRNPGTYHKLCPDGKEHQFITDPSEPSYMCDTAYICVNCGFTQRVDSSD